ncbi:MAG: hypothetical protein Ta2D_07510 [Rickettsiales bacterium]|nr:MAG: hypothetical protein Ta2D_07510 [Rickettsiales bacterium]
MILFKNNELQNAEKVLIAVSGGCDSLALTFMANEWGLQNNKEIYTITIDHKIRVPDSTDEANYIHSLLQKHNIKHIIKTCENRLHSEEEAREFRYNAIFDYMKQEKIKVVLFAHHLQDQAENFLIRLFRGSGIKGLSSMKEVVYRGDFIIVRPLLNEKKEDLQQYLIDKNIKWCEDESNSDEVYLRNKIRNFLNSFPNKYDIINRINNEVSIFQKANALINSNTQIDNPIDIDNFKKLDIELQYSALTSIINSIGTTKQIRFAKIKRFIDDIDILDKYTLGGCIFEKKGGQIMVYKEKKVNVIGITGNIASGKSTLVKHIKKNFKVFECDNEVAKLYKQETFLKRISDLLGTSDKKEISQIVFNDKAKKKELENLIHPVIEKMCDDFIKENDNERYIFIDVPLLYEVGWDKKCDKVILVSVERDIQKQRFIKRTGNAELFEKIIKEQCDAKSISKKADYVIENNGTLDEFYEKIKKIKFIK